MGSNEQGGAAPLLVSGGVPGYCSGVISTSFHLFGIVCGSLPDGLTIPNSTSIAPFPAKNASFEQLLYKTNHFAKTGSGQT